MHIFVRFICMSSIQTHTHIVTMRVHCSWISFDDTFSSQFPFQFGSFRFIWFCCVLVFGYRLACASHVQFRNCLQCILTALDQMTSTRKKPMAATEESETKPIMPCLHKLFSPLCVSVRCDLSVIEARTRYYHFTVGWSKIALVLVYGYFAVHATQYMWTFFFFSSSVRCLRIGFYCQFVYNWQFSFSSLSEQEKEKQGERQRRYVNTIIGFRIAKPNAKVNRHQHTHSAIVR